MNLTELKRKPASELVNLADQMGIDGVSRSRKQDVIFSILKAHAKKGEDISGDGVLEILQDGFGFLRSNDCSYLAGPDDIYVSPSQIKLFGLKTGDTIRGKIRPPKEGEKYFALLKVESVNGRTTEEIRDRIAFEYLTPLFPQEKLDLSNGPTSYSMRMLNLFNVSTCSTWQLIVPTGFFFGCLYFQIVHTSLWSRTAFLAGLLSSRSVPRNRYAFHFG